MKAVVVEVVEPVTTTKRVNALEVTRADSPTMKVAVEEEVKPLAVTRNG
jgi:hypothetical protein